jgi:hypothetical protein
MFSISPGFRARPALYQSVLAVINNDRGSPDLIADYAQLTAAAEQWKSR